jgi:hypothetical protein
VFDLIAATNPKQRSASSVELENHGSCSFIILCTSRQRWGVRAGELWWTHMRKEGRERGDAYGT